MINEVKIHTTFQFAPRAIAHVRPGHNEFDVVFLSGTGGRFENSAVCVEVVWDEIRTQ